MAHAKTWRFVRYRVKIEAVTKGFRRKSCMIRSVIKGNCMLEKLL